MKRKLPLALIAVLECALILSLGFSFYLYLLGRSYYEQLNRVKLDPLGLSAYPQQAGQTAAKSSSITRVVFLGDSRASMWPGPAGLSEFEFINRGIGSQTTAQILARYDLHVRPLNPDILVLQMGINDLKTIPLFPEQKQQIIANCKANIQAVVRAAQQQKAIVVLTTIFPEGGLPLERRLFWSEDVKESTGEVNAFIKQLAGEGVLVLDTVPILANDQGLVKEQYSLDFLHLNPTGYEILNTELRRVLLSIQSGKRDD